jgi:heterogeneous nuclear rnp K-like protein 2
MEAAQASPPPVSSDEILITLKALVSSKDAGIIIGKQGKKVSQVRDQTGVKIGLTPVTTGVNERILSIHGQLLAVSKVDNSQKRLLLWFHKVLSMAKTQMELLPQTQCQSNFL